ncbi:ParB-like partition protein [Mycobacterium phage Zemanar]|uniref:ParB-like nuclease domain protein n=2 Tax=Coopervirus TaxID=1982898 RepID=A0A7G8LFP7_9CAUD|nr:ParB-like partition protein [Mycobacterium phage Zemanar]YP_010109544.1 ParB-like partition protein [Mycobacterium phage Heath]AEJ95676.1 ParB-like nuclease domain protein [Mycobacterium phage Zemanar]QNJ56069.1 ParB-like nuclease domain protein [Mycobacterium phage Heath]
MASTSTVGKTTSVPPSALNLFHKNPRRGDVSAIMSSLRRHTQYKPITANVGTHTGRAAEVLAGNHTLMAFRELAAAEPNDKRWQKMLVHWVDVDDDMAERIVVADNQTGRLGGFDDAELAELVAGFDGDTEGLGFTDADLDDLNAILEERADLPPMGDPFAKDGKESTGSTDDDPDADTGPADAPGDPGSTRMVVLTLPIPRFVWVQQALERARVEFGVETNTDAVVALLEQWTGTEAPADTERLAAAADELLAEDPAGFTDDDD